MTRRLRAAMLLTVMLLASLAPSALVSLHADEAGMGCCATEDHCNDAAIKRACCPCAPGSPADPPATARAVQPTPQLLAAAPWQLASLDSPGAIGADTGRAFARLAATTAPSPPWLLHGAFLI